jgi:hypothetical protein
VGALIKNKILILFLFIFLVLVVAFYPKYYLIIDEAHYTRTSYLITQGSVSVPDELHGYIFSQTADGTYSSKYPLGMSILLTPFIFIGFNYIFLLNILIHIFAFICFYLILKDRKIPEVYSGLYLFMPFLAYYSFTLFTDYTITGLLMISTYFLYVSKNRFRYYIIGGLFSTILFTKPTVVIFMPFLFLPKVINAIKERYYNIKPDVNIKEMTQTLLVFLPFFFIFVVMFLGKILTGYASDDANTSFFIFDNLNPVKDFFILLFYQLLSITLIFPFMSFILFKEYKQPYVHAVIAYILVFSFIDYTGTVTKITSPFSLIRNVRYTIPIMVLLLPSYCFYIDFYLKKVFTRKSLYKAAIFVMISGLVLSSGFLLYMHHQATTRNREFVNAVYSNTEENSLIVSNTLAYFLQDRLGQRMYLGIDDYGNTVDGKFIPSLPGHNNSKEHIEENINKYPTYIVITKSDSTNDIAASKAILSELISEHNGTMIYLNEFACKGFCPTIDRISVEIYKLAR